MCVCEHTHKYMNKYAFKILGLVGQRYIHMYICVCMYLYVYIYIHIYLIILCPYSIKSRF